VKNLETYIVHYSVFKNVQYKVLDITAALLMQRVMGSGEYGWQIVLYTYYIRSTLSYNILLSADPVATD